MADPNWLGINIDQMTNLSFWARGAKGGEQVEIKFYDTRLNKPEKDDGHFKFIKLTNIAVGWTKYSYSLFGLTNGKPGKRPLNLDLFEGFSISGSQPGTVVYFDDMKFGMKDRVELIYAPVKINRLGYRPGDKKTAVINVKADTFSVLDNATKKNAFTGKTLFITEKDRDSGDMVSWIDFSGLNIPGTYIIQLPDGTKSGEFRIADDVYNDIYSDIFRFFYFQRCGSSVDAEYGGKYVRRLCHKGDVKAAFAMRLDGTRPKGTLDVSGGWHDAGDDNKYSPNEFITLWYLVQAYELFPHKFKDGQFRIPENANGIPDIIDEMLWESEWLRKMQVKKGKEAGLVYSKVGQIDDDARNPDIDYLDLPRYVFQPTTADTASFAATMSMMARLLVKQSDRKLQVMGRKYRKAAEKAFEAYMKFSHEGTKQYPSGGFRNPDGWGGSTAVGKNLNEEKKLMFNAACELYALTKDKKYHDIIRKNIDAYITLFKARDITWGVDEFIGFFDYLNLEDKDTDPEVRQKMKETVRLNTDIVNKYVADNAYRVPLGQTGHFCWGSNCDVLKVAANFYYLYLWDRKQEDMDTVRRSFDYVMGLNAVDKNMFTGWGKALMFHRYWNNPEEQPPGYMVGGVDIYDGNAWMSKYPQKCYRDSTHNWAVNEAGIYYQASCFFIFTVFMP